VRPVATQAGRGLHGGWRIHRGRGDGQRVAPRAARLGRRATRDRKPALANRTCRLAISCRLPSPRRLPAGRATRTATIRGPKLCLIRAGPYKSVSFVSKPVSVAVRDRHPRRPW